MLAGEGVVGGGGAKAYTSPFVASAVRESVSRSWGSAEHRRPLTSPLKESVGGGGGGGGGSSLAFEALYYLSDH
jgi:hypothetical protein